jgi:hypothetical protein
VLDAFQNDFAARMQWTLTDKLDQVNHAPVVVVNGSSGPQPLQLEVEAGQTVLLDASESFDPDGTHITFHWFHYREPTVAMGLMPQQIPQMDIVTIDGEQPGRKVEIKMPPAEKCGIDCISGEALLKGQVYHYILEVRDSGTPTLTTYKRVVLQTMNSGLRGRRGFAVETSSDWCKLV